MTESQPEPEAQPQPEAEPSSESKSKSISKLQEWLDEPDDLFKSLLWIEPCLLLIAWLPVLFFIRDKPSDFIGKAFLVWYFLPKAVLFLYSKWYRKWVTLICFMWFVLAILSGTTQGALSSAISKAFSAIVSQTNALEHH